jgi:hypothetical protein
MAGIRTREATRRQGPAAAGAVTARRAGPAPGPGGDSLDSHARLLAGPGGRHAAAIQLQRSFGNAYVQRLLERIRSSGSVAAIQRKITAANERDMEYFFGPRDQATRFLREFGPERAWTQIDMFLRSIKGKTKPTVEEIAEYYGVEVREPIVEPEESNEERMFTLPDGHEGKHLKYSGKSIKELEKMTREGKAATFVGEWATNYNAKLALVIAAAFATNAQFVDCGEAVGVDAGVETEWVELYYGGSIGSHMRPKVGSQVKGGKTATL